MAPVRVGRTEVPPDNVLAAPEPAKRTTLPGANRRTLIWERGGDVHEGIGGRPEQLGPRGHRVHGRGGNTAGVRAPEGRGASHPPPFELIDLPAEERERRSRC